MINNKILSSTKAVVDNSKHVKINMDRLNQFSDNIAIENSKHWISSLPYDLNRLSSNQKVNFLLIMHSIGFCYWGEPKWTVDYQGENFDGSFGMIVALGKAIENGCPILDYEYLSNVSQNDFEEILRGNIQVPLFNERLNNIKEIGNIVCERFDGDFINAFEQVNSDVDLLDIIIESFPSFCDKSIYNDKEVYFYKRAQLLVADIFQIMPGQNYGIENLSRLTAFADYKIPQCLRHLGILEYDEGLAHLVDNKIEIEKGSSKEVEIRANAVWVVELIKERVKIRYKNINSVMINDQLWLMSQKMNNAKPYHRVRTTAY